MEDNNTNMQNLMLDLEHIKEFAYYPDPVAVSLFLRERYKNRRFAVYRESEHALNVARLLLDMARVISLSPKDGYITMDEAKSDDYDFIVLLGWWPDCEFMDFCKSNFIDRNRVLRPYHDEQFKKSVRLRNSQIIPDNYIQPSLVRPNIILFVIHDIKDFVTRHSKYLSKEFNLIKIYLHSKEAATEDNQYFAQTKFLDFNFHLLSSILSKFEDKIDMVIMHLPDPMFWVFMYIKKLFPAKKFINLVTEGAVCVYGSDKRLCLRRFQMTDEKYERQKIYEEFLYTESDLILTNLGGEVLSMLEERFKKNILFLSTPFGMLSFVPNITSAKRCINKGFSLVFAGSCSNSRMIMDDSYEYDLFFIPIYKRLLAQGFSIHMFISSSFINDLSGMKDSGIYSEYFKLEDAESGFTIHPTVNNADNIDVMRNFDFGIMLYNLTDDSLQDMSDIYSSTVHAKLFSYLAAGLPVIINKELKIQADFIEKHNLGIAISKDELDNLSAILGMVDYCELRHSVAEFNKNYEVTFGIATSCIISNAIKTVMGKV